MPGLAARVAAAGLLAGVLDLGRSLADQEPGLAALQPAERARAQAQAALVLRHLQKIDAFLAGFLARKAPAIAMNALRIAVAEVHLDGVPPHAAVDGAVRVVRTGRDGHRLAGFVNAVARRAAEAGQDWVETPEGGLPAWLARPLEAAWGAEARAAIETAHRERPPTDLTLKSPDEAARWAEALGATLLPTGSLRLTGWPQVSGLAGYDTGDWWVQDAAAALPVRLLGPLAGRTALDLCAAPGGKTLQLAAAGAAVTALDVSETRLKRLHANLSRTGLAAEVVAADARFWSPGRLFDTVLLDAPCTATGTIRRHPDLPWLGEGRDVAPFVEAQAALLQRAWEWVAPGGRLVYCVCSLFPDEGEAQAAAFAAETGARIVQPDVTALGVPAAWVDAAGGLRLRPDFWPENGGLDGFYAVAFARD